MSVKGAIFDLDGTIVDSMSMWHDVTVRLLEEQGVNNPEEVFRETEPEPLSVMCRLLHERYGAPDGSETLRLRFLSLVRDAYSHSVDIYPGCREFLRELVDVGVKLCVASSTSEPEVRCALEAQGVEDLFDFVLSADELGVSKEKPDVYLEALRRLGTPMEATWVFEDSPFGLRSAHRAGFPTVCIFNGHDGRDEALCRAESDIFSHGYVELSLALLEDFFAAPKLTKGELRALVVDGSPQVSSAALVSSLAQESDYVIAADRGAEALHEVDIVPDVFCGDFDSVSEETRVWADASAPLRIAFPSQKYTTDLSSAIECARHEAARRGERLHLSVTCATGGRPDHSLAVLGLLAAHADACPRLVEDGFECRMLSPEGTSSWTLGPHAVGSTISVIALAPGSCVSEQGLRWELDHRKLPLLGDEGVSNVVVSADAVIECHAGIAAVFIIEPSQAELER